MYENAADMIAKKKRTGSIVCIVAAVVLAGSLFLPWLKAKKGEFSMTMSLLSIEACGGSECQSRSNRSVARELRKTYDEMAELRASMRSEMDDGDAMRMPKKPGTAFAYVGMATLAIGLLGAAALLAAGIFGLKGRFIDQPMALTTVGLVATSLGLVLGCVFIAIKPDQARVMGVSWPFFLFGAAVVGAVAGAQMLAKAFAPPEYDPYADPGADQPLP